MPTYDVECAGSHTVHVGEVQVFNGVTHHCNRLLHTVDYKR